MKCRCCDYTWSVGVVTTHNSGCRCSDHSPRRCSDHSPRRCSDHTTVDVTTTSQICKLNNNIFITGIKKWIFTLGRNCYLSIFYCYHLDLWNVRISYRKGWRDSIRNLCFAVAKCSGLARANGRIFWNIIFGMYKILSRAHHAEGRVDPKVRELQNGFRFWIHQSM
jgi:hypothetical protein